MMIDTHAHLYDEAFATDLQETIQRAELAGVDKILLPAIDNSSYERQEELYDSRPDMFGQMMGLHPTSVGADMDRSLNIAKERLYKNPNRYVGIGEIGLDFYWDTTYRNEQIVAFTEQLRWAKEMEKPVSIHLRSAKEIDEIENDAYETALPLIESIGKSRGVMHCFSGTIEQARRAIAMGFSLGVGGIVTYKKSSLPRIIESIDIQHIVLETDAPYLAPTPYRGKRNEPSYMIYVAQKIAEIKQLGLEEVCRETSRNAQRLFDLR